MSGVLELMGYSLPMEILKWEVPELREACKSRGGSPYGTKKELIHRLVGLTNDERNIEDRLTNDEMEIDDIKISPDKQVI